MTATVAKRGDNVEAILARRQKRVVAFMVVWFGRFFRQHMNALRLARWGRPDLAGAGPVVVYSNHPAWWDAAVYVLLGRRFMPERACYAPIDAAMLAKYGFFARIGAFGVDLDHPRGAAAFLRAAAAVLGGPDRALWVTAQGRFADPRQRPLGLRAGVARLPELAPDATFLPLALDYVFWTERGAEALAAFGAPLRGADLASLPRPERLARLEAALAQTMDRLAADAISRDPARFEALIEGQAGVGGVYDLWRRAKAWAGGRRFTAAHADGLGK